MSDGIRINRYLSEAGICSRREADRLVESCVVKINENIAEAGARVMPGDVVYVNDRPVKHDEKPVVLVYNKPAGVVCSTKERDNIVDYIRYPVRIYPVGRLDKNSEGLILLTNQGDIADAILRAANYHEKEYVVEVNRNIDDEFVRGMERGVPILDTVTRPCKMTVTGKRSFHITITQGLNRQIRRMCEYYDYRVLSLKRIRIMYIKLENIKSGEYREMSEEEIRELRDSLGLQGN